MFIGRLVFLKGYTGEQMIICMLIITVLLVAADQAIKFWAVSELSGSASREFIKIAGNEIVNLTYTENTGAAFSFMSGQQWFTIGFASVALIIFTLYMIKNYRESKMAIDRKSVV